MSNKELTSMLLEATGQGWDLVEHVEDRKGHDLRHSLDIGKIRKELGYSPRISFADGLAATVRWYGDHRAWWEPLKKRAALTR